MYNYDELTKEFMSDKTLIIIEKNCGYKFVVPLLENSTLMDLYRYVELLYAHITTTPIDLYYVKDTFKKIIPKSYGTTVLEFVRNNNIRPCTDYPDKVMYNFSLDICGEHC